ncbi:aldehyde ferredoxin oxidoreductase family protein [Ideonella sp.]|uniref:aldehyde ferredoxin oxidoreductase family protein n=1 Tax=Ideonella sp. TaxID=1929293 RepID=UPI003BB51732
MSWAGKILRVNLSTGTVQSEPLNMDWARSYLGSRGLASKYLVEELDAKVDPLSPDNKIIWSTGPLTGTMASTGGRYTVVTKGPLTGAIACSNSGGYWGAELKMAGWDMIIFEGASPKPVYLFVQDDVAELRDAAHLWGKTVWDTEAALKSQHQDPLLRVSSIGGAGENQVLFAAVVNDLHRAAGRSGVGAVMGSKNLKAIAVRGTLGVGNIADPKEFMRVTFEKKKILQENAVTGAGLPAYGTQVLMSVINEVGALPTRNHRDVQFEGAGDIGAEAMGRPRSGPGTDGKTPLVTNQACFGCTIACGRIQKIDQNHFTVENKPKYWGASGGLEYEAAWALGAANGVKDLDTLQYANVLCNEHGMDPITFGATIGAVMELYDMGVLTKEQIGIDAQFGSAQALAYFAEITAKGEGFGKEIGQGSKRLCEKYGHPELSMSVKGQEFPAYDARGIQGIGLAYATSNRGACHLRGYTIASEVLGIPVKTDPLESEGKPELVKAFQDATAAFDSAGLCIFTSFAWGLADVQPQVAAACGPEFTLENLSTIGERIWNMERDFNNRAGFTSKDDSLPPRLLKEAAKTGPAKGMVNKLPEMLPKYYAARGWDADGQLTADTRSRLGL